MLRGIAGGVLITGIGSGLTLTNGVLSDSGGSAPGGSAGGDLAGTYPNPLVNHTSVADGSVTAPAMAFVNELSTGFYRSAAGVVTLTNLGTGKLSFSVGAIFPVTNHGISLGQTTNAFQNVFYNGITVSSGSNKAIPTTGQTVTIGQTTAWQLIAPAGTLASLTVQFPTPLADGHEFDLTINQTITGLTLTPNSGATINGGFTVVTGYMTARFHYYAADTAWYRTNQ